MGHCRRQGPIPPRINGKISGCSCIDCGLLQLSGLLGNGYLSPLNCYLGSPSFCAGWHFPPLPPRANSGQPGEQRHACLAPLLGGRGLPTVTSAQLIGVPPSPTLSWVVSPGVPCLRTAVSGQPWDLLTFRAKHPGVLWEGRRDRVESVHILREWKSPRTSEKENLKPNYILTLAAWEAKRIPSRGEETR